MGKRMFYVLKIILSSSKQAIMASEIQILLEKEGIKVDIKTVRTCIQQINDFFYEWLQRDLIITYHRKGYQIDEDIFDDGQLQFLLDQLAFHQDLNQEDQQKLQHKLLFLSSFHQQQRLIFFESSQRQHSFLSFVNLSVIMKAIEHQKAITFEYIDYDIQKDQLVEVASQRGNKEKQYIVSPYSFTSQNNHYYMIAYNEKHLGQLTNYRIDRMRKIQTLNNGYIDIREQFDIQNEIEKMMNMFISHHHDTLVIECDYKQLREMVSRFGQQMKVQRLYQDRLLLTIEDVSISEGLIGWIMMMQTQIKVISPKYLQDEMKARIKAMHNLYQDVL
ncbi:WYL domain-containing protein [Allocoprobacillus halotolerans]|uniref:WYL domain-containing protein n=1 Tax=Allocoprobacillus halotolerans TaxID=2944914 RepID=A0ABY5I4N7_9FIRM|nr:WYL domain-containing protein [Allocoprobacillus halotolerans]UTY39925.1 WYL domain-containing protein [Allocoprobacillus halotolerans]